MLAKISIFYISVHLQHREKRRQFKIEESVSRFFPLCGEELGEHDGCRVKCDSKRKAPIQSPFENIKRLKQFQARTNCILPVRELLCTQRCLQCTIVHTKIVDSWRRRALEQKYQQKRPFARLYTKYR